MTELLRERLIECENNLRAIAYWRDSDEKAPTALSLGVVASCTLEYVQQARVELDHRRDRIDELLNALRACMAIFPSKGIYERLGINGELAGRTIENARAAIAKAEGK